MTIEQKYDEADARYNDMARQARAAWNLLNYAPVDKPRITMREYRYYADRAIVAMHKRDALADACMLASVRDMA